MKSEYILDGGKDVYDFPKVSIGKILFEKIKQHGDNVAFIDGLGHETYTYSEILKKTIKLCTILKKLGAKKNDVVAIMSENSIQYYIPYLACLFSGFISHTINPEYTSYELNHALIISKPKIMFISNAAKENVIISKLKWPFIQFVIILDANKDEAMINMDLLIELTDMNYNFKPEVLNPDEQIACIINSSGTTGLPKGVMLTHTNISRILAYTGNKHVAFNPSDVLMGDILFFHIFGTMVMLPTIFYGGKIVIISTVDNKVYLSLIEQYKATKCYMAPPMALFLVKANIVNDYDLTSLKKLFVGGALLSSKINVSLEERLNLRVHVMYGLTETSGGVTYNPMFTNNYKSIGVLNPGIKCKVTDTVTGNILPANTKGELCFYGDCIMKGYMNNKKATDEAIDDEHFLHTGDVGYYDENGYLYVVDRIKDIIKYRGFSVSPIEIETFLLTHKDIYDAAVIGIPNSDDGEQAIAFVIRKNESNITETDIIKFVKDNLSSEKQLQGRVRFVNYIPKNAGGKIIRKLLRETIS